MLVLAYVIVAASLLFSLSKAIVSVVQSDAGRETPVLAACLTLTLWALMNSGLFWAEIQVLRHLGVL